MKIKLLNKILTSIFFAFSVINTSFAMTFNDVPIDFWAYGQIDKMTDAGIIDYYPDNLFKPSNLITRAEYAQIVIKTINQQDIPIEKMYSFEDIDRNNKVWPYVIRAVNLDIIKPVSDSYFYPNDYVTRSEIITFLVNILKSENITKNEAIQALQNSYDDFDDIPDWFKYTAGKAEILNVIAKEPPRQKFLDYDRYVTRAQIAYFMNALKEKTESYIQEKIKEETSPKMSDGIIIENVILNDDIATLQAQTVIPIMISGQIHSKNSYPGKMFNAKFANNIIDNEHHLLLSKDIILIGKILDTTKAVTFIRNGELIFELSAANKNNNLTRILGVAECEASITEGGKIKRTVRKIKKGKNFVAKDGQILYIRLFKPLRINIVTGEILD